MNLIFLDTETTGFGNCRLVELAWKRPDELVRSFRVKPPIPMTEGAIATHGITEDMVSVLEAFDKHVEYVLLKQIFEESVIVAHNASFDIGVLGREGITVKRFIDTKKIAQKVYKNLPSHKLQDLREYFHFETDAVAHSAEGDVLVLEMLFGQIRADLEARGTAPEQVLDLMLESSMRGA